MNKPNIFFRVTTFLVLVSFLWEILSPFPAYASSLNTLPAPTQLIALTPKFNPPSLRGLKFYPDNPLRFDFIIDEGDNKLTNPELKAQSSQFIKYFLASLTIPEQDLWVNLSPAEKDRVIPQELGLTEMGVELLAQDYILKQLVGSLTYPESPQGRRFWDRVYQKATQLFGTSKIPINTFNKVWIVPDKAEVFEDQTKAILGDTHLKVMLEEDYLLLKDNLNNPEAKRFKLKEEEVKEINNFSSQLMKEVILPELEKEVNAGKNFQELRQIYHSLILATWFKQKLKSSILNQVYINQKKLKGIDTDDPESKEKIYQLYLKAYSEGLYNYIRKDIDPLSKKTIRRRYYSGGFDGTGIIGVVGVGSSPLTNITPEQLGKLDPTPQTPLQEVKWQAKPVPESAEKASAGLPVVVEESASSAMKTEVDTLSIDIILNDLRLFLRRRGIENVSESELKELAQRIYLAQQNAAGRAIIEVDLEGIDIPGVTSSDTRILGMMGMGGVPIDNQDTEQKYLMDLIMHNDFDLEDFDIKEVSNLGVPFFDVAKLFVFTIKSVPEVRFLICIDKSQGLKLMGAKEDEESYYRRHPWPQVVSETYFRGLLEDYKNNSDSERFYGDLTKYIQLEDEVREKIWLVFKKYLKTYEANTSIKIELGNTVSSKRKVKIFIPVLSKDNLETLLSNHPLTRHLYNFLVAHNIPLPLDKQIILNVRDVAGFAEGGFVMYDYFAINDDEVFAHELFHRVFEVLQNLEKKNMYYAIINHFGKDHDKMYTILQRLKGYEHLRGLSSFDPRVANEIAAHLFGGIFGFNTEHYLMSSENTAPIKLDDIRFFVDFGLLPSWMLPEKIENEGERFVNTDGTIKDNYYEAVFYEHFNKEVDVDFILRCAKILGQFETGFLLKLLDSRDDLVTSQKKQIADHILDKFNKQLSRAFDLIYEYKFDFFDGLSDLELSKVESILRKAKLDFQAINIMQD